MLINRRQELNDLENRFASDLPEMLVVYGRPRTGMTTLLRRFCENKSHLYLHAVPQTEAGHLEELGRRIGEAFPSAPRSGAGCISWAVGLEYLTRSAGRKKVVVVFDGFPTFCDAQVALPSILSTWWDGGTAGTSFMVVLCGSHLSFMKHNVLASSSPLSRRCTGRLELAPLEPWDVGCFFPGWNACDRLAAFGILGGSPGYLRCLDADRPLFENLVHQMLRPEGRLFREPLVLLRQELMNVAVYVSLLRAIAEGAIYVDSIAAQAGIAPASAETYLQTLIDMGIVRREASQRTGGNGNGRGTGGAFSIVDPMLLFWCRFVLPNQGLIEAGGGVQVMNEQILPHWEEIMALRFREVCRRYVAARWAGRFGAVPSRITTEAECASAFDLVADLDDGGWHRILAGMCCYATQPLGPEILGVLAGQPPRRPGSEGAPIERVLFGAVGFTSELAARAAAQGVRLISGEEMLAADGES